MLKSPETAIELVKSLLKEHTIYLKYTCVFTRWKWNIYPKKLCRKSIEKFREIAGESKYELSFKTDFNSLHAKSINSAVVKLDDQ